jgi:hypothetical protein
MGLAISRTIIDSTFRESVDGLRATSAFMIGKFW